MTRYFSHSVLLLFFLVVIVCGIYPFALWIVGQTLFPFQANGSLIIGADGEIVGSKLIAQSFTKEEYFQSRPSAANYDASASASSALAASNYALRDRVARAIGPIVKYNNGKSVRSDIEKWFSENQSYLIAIWEKSHHSQFPSKENIASLFFDRWRQAHPDILLRNVPGDYVTTSASGLDPHITLQNAFFQLDRVAMAWANRLNRHSDEVASEIHSIIMNHTEAPWNGLIGEPFINVLEVNLELHNRYGAS
jgi:potassium-transporting ATPase KdpC subunit